MKRLMFFIFFEMMLLFCTMPVYAANYTIDTLQIELTTPEDWTTFIRDTKPSSEDLHKLDIDYWSLWKYFRNNDIYLLSISDDETTAILLKKYQNDQLDLLLQLHDDPEDLEKEQIDSLMTQYKKEHPEDITYTGWELYLSAQQFHYLVFEYWYDSNGQRIYCRQYITAYDGQCLDLTLTSYGSKITSDYAAAQKGIIDSLVFPTSLKVSPKSDASQLDPEQSQPAFSETASVDTADYIIDALQMEVRLPSNWLTLIRDSQPQQDALDRLKMDQKMLSEYFERNQCYLLSFSDDGISEMTLETYTGPGIQTIMRYAKGSENNFEENVIKFMTNYQAQYPGITFTGWDFFTTENQFKCLVLQYWYDLQNQRVYCQQYISSINGQDLSLTLRSYGSEITDESAAVQKELANSFYIEENEIMTPEQSGALAAKITIDILFTWLLIHFIWNKISDRLRRKRGWTAELDTNAMTHQYEETECLKKANYEIRMNLILGFMYFITTYFYILSFLINTGGDVIQIAGLSSYGFRALMKNRKESITIIDHILSEAFPEKKKSYQRRLTIIMLLFQFLLFWPLFFVICMVGFIFYLFLMSLR